MVEHAWRAGARFDGWDEHFDLQRWEAALEACGVDRMVYLNTIPVDGRLPWDHIDVGLKEGFLAWEYRRAMKDRLSHPCGKPFKTLLHHANIEDAIVDARKLVCFDCGIACDMTQMREERIVYLRKLGATKDQLGTTPSARRAPLKEGEAPFARGRTQAPVAFAQSEGRRFRLRYAKRGRGAFISHLDTMRLLVRVFRRAGVEMIYSKGYHPKPILAFAPALGLGVAALSELADVRVVWDGDGESLRALLASAAPGGFVIEEVRALADGEPPLSKTLAAAEYAAWLPNAVELSAQPAQVVRRSDKKEAKTIDVARLLADARIIGEEDAARLRAELDWPEGGAVLGWRLKLGDDGGARPSEVIESLTGAVAPESTRYCRVALLQA